MTLNSNRPSPLSDLEEASFTALAREGQPDLQE